MLVLTPGGLYLQRQYGLIMVAVRNGTHQQQRHTKGQILVERDPVKYVGEEADVANYQSFSLCVLIPI